MVSISSAEPFEASSETVAQWEESYPDLLYAVLFHPVATFKTLGNEANLSNRILLYALFSVILISAMMPVIQLASMGGSPVSLALTIPLSVVVGALIWVFIALIIALLSYAFANQTRFRTLLVLSGLATLPWLLMGPVSLFKYGLGPVGAVLCAIFGLLIWLWSVLLFALSIVNTYSMTAERVLVILVMPFVMTLVFCGWIFGFFSNISNLVPH